MWNLYAQRRLQGAITGGMYYNLVADETNVFVIGSK